MSEDVFVISSGKSLENANTRDFVLRNGTDVFGVIPEEVGREIDSPSAPIKLRVGNEDWGLRHIEMKHGEEIRVAGFTNAASFVAHVIDNTSELFGAKKERLMLVEDSANKKGKSRGVAFIELEKRDEFYDVITAYRVRKVSLEMQQEKISLVDPRTKGILKPPPPQPIAPTTSPRQDGMETGVRYGTNETAESISQEQRTSDVQTLEINGGIYPITFDVDINHEYFLNKEKRECLYTDQDPNFQSCKSSRVTVTLETDDGDKFIASVTDQGLDGMKSKVIWADKSNKPDDEIQKEIALKLKTVAYDRIWDELLRNIPKAARDFGEKYEWSDEETEKLIQSTELYRDPERNPNNLNGVNTQVHLDLSNLNVVDMTSIAFRRFTSLTEREGQSNVQNAYMVGETEKEINQKKFEHER